MDNACFLTRGGIFVISGPSGVGKGTLCRRLLEAEPSLALSTSVTSRPPRPGEIDGVDYCFVTRQGFEARVTAGDFLEWAEYNGHLYGTPVDQVAGLVEQGRYVLLEIDTQGAFRVQERFPEACLIFITPPSLEELEARLRQRGANTEDDLRNRLEITRRELLLVERFHHTVVNDTLERCQTEVLALMRHRMGRQTLPVE